VDYRKGAAEGNLVPAAPAVVNSADDPAAFEIEAQLRSLFGTARADGVRKRGRTGKPGKPEDCVAMLRDYGKPGLWALFIAVMFHEPDD